MEEWHARLPDAHIIINANFFDAQNAITGLLIRDGVAFGWNYTDRGGTFAIRDAIPRITHNIYQPFDMQGAQYAIQGFPMLVYNGEAIYTQSGRGSRRTAIGQDRQGRILIFITPILGPSLDDFSEFLARPEFDLVNAFNLDGGRSTMVWVSKTPINQVVQSIEPVPAILAVYPR